MLRTPCMLHWDSSLSSGARPQVLRMDGVYCNGIDTIHHSDAADAGSAELPVRRRTASVRRAPGLCRLLADAPRGCHLKRRACSSTKRDFREPGAVHTSGISITRCERRSCLKRTVSLRARTCCPHVQLYTLRHRKSSSSMKRQYSSSPIRLPCLRMHPGRRRQETATAGDGIRAVA